MAADENNLWNENRYFDPDPATRKVARELYDSVKDLPIVSPHGHVDPKLFADNNAFLNPTDLLIAPDHYILRMLYSQGISMDALGVPARNGSAFPSDPREAWQVFGSHYHLFAGTPTGAWMNYVFHEVFSIEEKLNSDSAMKIYDRIQDLLEKDEYRPRSFFERFNIEVLSTTDSAADSLEYHQAIKESGWQGRIIPCFRPDKVMNILSKTWKRQIKALGRASGVDISSYPHFITALEKRRAFFKSLGAVATDQAMLTPFTHETPAAEMGTLFHKAYKGKATPQDAILFSAQMLMEMARMSIEDGLVMQIHPGSFRDHNPEILNKYGSDMGGDIPLQTEFTRSLRELLNKYGNHPQFTLVVYTLDETTYSRELAPLAGHYPALKLGAPWWFHDSIAGITRFRERTMETAGLHNTAGFTDDTRTLPSIPARHDLSRRVDCNFLARWVVRHIIDRDDAMRMSRDLAYDQVKKSFGL